MIRRLLMVGLFAGCAHVPPGDTAGVPPPWPKADPPVVRKQEPPPPPPPATPNPPQSR